MLIMTCPTCKTHLIEESKSRRIDCLKCGDEFSFLDAEYRYMSYTEIYHAMREIHPEKIPGVKEKSDKQARQEKIEKVQAVLEAIKRREEEDKAMEAKEIEAGALSGREECLEVVRELRYGFDDNERLVKK